MTRPEIAAALHGQVARFERLGLGHARAVQAVAADNGLQREEVEHFVGVADEIFGEVVGA